MTYEILGSSVSFLYALSFSLGFRGLYIIYHILQMQEENNRLDTAKEHTLLQVTPPRSMLPFSLFHRQNLHQNTSQHSGGRSNHLQI